MTNPMMAQPTAAPNEVEATPEEQAQLQEFVTNGVHMMNTKEGAKKIVQAIQADGDPVTGLATAVSAIIMRLEDSAEKKGVEIDSDILMHGGAELMSVAADLSKQVGAHQFTDEEIEAAAYKAIDMYRVTRQEQGKLDQQAIGEDLQMLQAAEQQGGLESVLPGISQAVQGMDQPAAPGVPPAAPPQPLRGLAG